jgi:glycosyltransferase involved in cell wall biosynthesis
MKLSILSLISSDQIGGVETYSIEYARALNSLGNQYRVVCPSDSLRMVFEKEGVEFVTLPDYRFLETRGSIVLLPNIIKSIVALYKIVSLYGASVLNINANSTSSLVMSIVASSIKGLPIVMTVHGVGPFQYRSYSSLLKIALRRSSAVIAISDEIKDELVAKYGYSEKIYVIPNGINLNKTERPVCKPMTGDPKLVLISRLDNEKIDAVFKAMGAMSMVHKECERATLDIIGGGVRMDEVSYKANKLNERVGGPIIRVLGEMTPTMVNEQISNSDVVLGAGRVALEGMALGKPVVFLSSGGYGGSLSPDNVVALKTSNFSGRSSKPNYSEVDVYNGIIDLMNPSRYSEVLQLTAQVIEEYNIDLLARRMESIFTEVL